MDPAKAFPIAFVIQCFIQGLRLKYVINVQASELATLNNAITTAR